MTQATRPLASNRTMVQGVAGRRASALMALAVGAASCSDAAGPEAFPETIDYDVAIVAADATLEDVTMWSHPLEFGESGPPSGRPGGHGGWSGDFSGTREVTFFDSGGAEQPAHDALTTDVIHILHEVEGEVTRDDWTVTVHRERDLTVSGLVGTETHRTWNGTGSEEVTRNGFTLAGSERSYDAVGTFTYHDVVVPVPDSTPRYPLSGTITRHMTVTVTSPGETLTREVDVVIEFNGTSRADATVNGVPREIDLATRAGRHPFGRR